VARPHESANMADSPLRRVRRSSPDRTWKRIEVAHLLGVCTRQVDRYKERGQLRPAPSEGGGCVFSNDEVLRFLLEDYHATRKAVRS